VSALLHLAGLAAATEGVDRAVGLVQQGLDQADGAGNEPAALACWLARGLLERQRGADEAAAGWIDRARERASALGYRRTIAACDLHLARIATDRGDPALAVSLYRHCLDIAGLDRRAEVVWPAWRELGWCLAESGDHEAAVPALTRALDLVSGTGRPSSELWCLVRLMWSQDSFDEPAVFEATARRCGELALSLPDGAFVAVGLLCAGDGARRTGDGPTARGYYEQALAIARECGPGAATQTIDGMWQLGRLAHLEGDAATADEHFRLTGLNADELGDQVAVAHVLLQLGRTRRDLGDAAAARTALEDAWRKALELGDARLAAASDLLLADLDDAAGRTEAADRRARVASRFPHRGAAVHPVEHPAAHPVEHPAEDHPVYLAAMRAWHELRWARRLRVADGEAPFTEPIGRSIDSIVRDLAPRASLIWGVPAAVAPRPTAGRSGG
jgi:tetratricopeptide (TPR) repeat protein